MEQWELELGIGLGLGGTESEISFLMSLLAEGLGDVTLGACGDISDAAVI